jgi:hypothetical protein
MIIDEEISRIIDAVAWAKTCLIIATQCPAGSVQRRDELRMLAEGALAARTLVDAYEVKHGNGKLSRRIYIELRTCEIGLVKLTEAPA